MSIIDKILGSGKRPIKSVSVQEALTLSADSEFVFVDVRNPPEWEETGLAEKAQSISLQDPLMVEKFLDAAKQDKTKPLLVMCKSGGRSSQACSILAEAGFTNITNVEGGMNAWLAAGLPTQRA